jgi:hypothetical protein
VSPGSARYPVTRGVSFVRGTPQNYIDPDGHSPCVNGTSNCYNPHNTDPNPANVNDNNPLPATNLTEKLVNGDLSVLPDLVIPSHFGFRIQAEVSVDVGIGLSFTGGVNAVYNRISDKAAANVDWAVEPGVGAGGGLSVVGGPVFGWGSSDVTNVTKGYSGLISGTAAAEVAVSAGISAPLDDKGFHVDPYTGQVPATIYVGGGVGGGYAGVGAGVNGPTGIFYDLTPLLPWHWK